MSEMTTTYKKYCITKLLAAPEEFWVPPGVQNHCKNLLKNKYLLGLELLAAPEEFWWPAGVQNHHKNLSKNAYFLVLEAPGSSGCKMAANWLQKWLQNGFKIVPNSLPKSVQKSFQNRCKMAPKSTPKWLHFGGRKN